MKNTFLPKQLLHDAVLLSMPLNQALLRAVKADDVALFSGLLFNNRLKTLNVQYRNKAHLMMTGTVVQLACAYGAHQCLTWALKNGGSPTKVPAPKRGLQRNRMDWWLDDIDSPYNEEPIAEAIRSNSVACLETLIAQGADPNCEWLSFDILGKWQPLAYAVSLHNANNSEADRTKLIQRLLQLGAKPNGKGCGFLDSAPLAVLLRNSCDRSVAHLLMDHGADPCISSAYEMAPQFFEELNAERCKSAITDAIGTNEKDPVRRRKI